MQWIKCSDGLPVTSDRSVLAYFENGSIETVHVEDHFREIANGVIDGIQQYTYWYLSAGITHWMELPEPPNE